MVSYFCDKLVESQNPFPRSGKMNLQENFCKIDLHDEDCLKPKCLLDERIMERLRKPLQVPMIIKFLDKSIVYFRMKIGNNMR